MCYAFLYAYLKSRPPNKYATNNKRSEATRIINQTRPATPPAPPTIPRARPHLSPKVYMELCEASAGAPVSASASASASAPAPPGVVLVNGAKLPER